MKKKTSKVVKDTTNNNENIKAVLPLIVIMAFAVVEVIGSNDSVSFIHGLIVNFAIGAMAGIAALIFGVLCLMNKKISKSSKIYFVIGYAIITFVLFVMVITTYNMIASYTKIADNRSNGFICKNNDKIKDCFKSTDDFALCVYEYEENATVNIACGNDYLDENQYQK